MLTITVPGVESFNDETQEFVTTDDTVLHLEHSLVSLSKWESKWEKPFLTGDSKTTEEVLDYFQSMSLDGEIPAEVLARLTEENLHALNQYIEAKMTATWFNETQKARPGSSETVTAEIIYHWMTALQIDWECQYWHLNRLITLVKTINEKNKASSDTKKKAPTTSDLANRRALMEKRRAEASGRA
jgi:hypothetical protein